MLTGKNVILGITGSIASYKTAYLASSLSKQHCGVDVIMTQNATKFISPMIFETLTGRRCVTDTFDRNFNHDVEHIALAKKADLIMIAPATANVIAKLSCGIADDILTTTVLASRAIKIVAPAMNTNMYENTVTRRNLTQLKNDGFIVLEPAKGLLACGDTGKGKMPEPEALYEHIIHHIALEKDLAGKKVIVTAGPTQEAIDPVRFVSNHSTGKMGYALAKACALRGADVTLISGKTTLTPPPFVKVVNVLSAQEMCEAVIAEFANTDIVFKAAAVADFTPAVTHEHKVKKHDSCEDDTFTLRLKRTKDILKELGNKKKPTQILCGFSMETRNMLENSKAKLQTKNLDMIVANNLNVEGAGFGTDTNIITIITADDARELPVQSKFDAANAVIDASLKLQTQNISGR